MIKAWISAGYVTKNRLVTTEKGVPQGAVISPLLANVYLDEFDKIISASDVKLVRYADDFLVLARTQDRIVQAYGEVVEALTQIKLEMHPQKTQIANFEQGFRFLGHGFLQQAIFPLESAKEKSSNSKKKLLKSRMQKLRQSWLSQI